MSALDHYDYHPLQVAKDGSLVDRDQVRALRRLADGATDVLVLSHGWNNDMEEAHALYERIAYDESGQLVTGTFVDYALPTAAELPSYETDRTETPSPVNTLGVKGVGEAGTIAASPAVTNAVLDALRPLGVTYLDMPLSPMRIWEAIQEAKGKAGAPA